MNISVVCDSNCYGKMKHKKVDTGSVPREAQASREVAQKGSGDQVVYLTGVIYPAVCAYIGLFEVVG